MNISIGLMPRGKFGTAQALKRIGEAAEGARLAKIWFGDHIVYPVEYAPNYPSESGRLSYNPATAQLDVTVAMTWLCAVTERIGVGTAVMVIAQRQLVWLAKQLASIDHLTGGRLTLGIGVGWCQEEFESLGVPFQRRGARTDEYVAALRRLWSEETPMFSGQFLSFPPLYANPKPVQRGGPPIWIGGFGEKAFDRVARYGAGWIALYEDVDEIARTLGEIRERAKALGREDAEQISVAKWAWQPTEQELAAYLRRLRDAGVSEAIVSIDGRPVDEAVEFISSLPGLII
jgi:probable F420-dependent oxidoreductase